MGGYPEYKGTPRLDSDGHGYTNIEKYINGINPKKKVDWKNLKNNKDTLAEKGKVM